ncbi:hypothetical protein Tco_0497473 [Tanacetum coccineum]
MRDLRYGCLQSLSKNDPLRFDGDRRTKEMKQEGLNRQIGILQKMEFDCKLMIGKLQDNEGTAQGTVQKYCFYSKATAHYAQSTARCESTAVMFEGEIVGNYRYGGQKNKRMKQEGLNRQIGILQKMEFDCKLMIGKLQDVT